MTHPDYQTLPNGTMKRINPPVIPYDQPYWGVDGRSSIEDQCFNVHGYIGADMMTKAEYILAWASGDSLIEIGCAPGSILKLAREKGIEAVGIEPCLDHIEFIENHSGCEVIHSFLETVEIEQKFGTVVSADCLEHAHDPEDFVRRCMELLEPAGRLILMLPVIREGEEFRNQDFCPEHVTLFSEAHLREWLNPIHISTWIPGHTLVVVEKGEAE